MKDVHETERYTTIDGFPDYLITSHGRVFSLKHGKFKELMQGKDKDGYMQLRLYKNGKSYTKKVHRLVAQAFIQNPDNKPQVNHIDEDKANNHVSNLEWMTAKENVNHGTRNERDSKIKTGKKHTEESKQKMSVSRKGRKMSEETKSKIRGCNNHNSKSVIGFKINGCDIKYYKYMSECKKDNLNYRGISRCCLNQRKSYCGYVWYYTDEFFNKNK